MDTVNIQALITNTDHSLNYAEYYLFFSSDHTTASSTKSCLLKTKLPVN